MADKLYLLPIQTSVIEEIIKKEKKDCPIDSILLSFGGQTALNCGLALEEQGILKKYNIKVLGTSPDTIRITEDRKLFNQQLAEIAMNFTDFILEPSFLVTFCGEIFLNPNAAS